MKNEYIEDREELDEIPFDKVFNVDGNEEFCHATGYAVKIDGEWWDEFEDRNGGVHYGR